MRRMTSKLLNYFSLLPLLITIFLLLAFIGIGLEGGLFSPLIEPINHWYVSAEFPPTAFTLLLSMMAIALVLILSFVRWQAKVKFRTRQQELIQRLNHDILQNPVGIVNSKLRDLKEAIAILKLSDNKILEDLEFINEAFSEITKFQNDLHDLSYAMTEQYRLTELNIAEIIERERIIVFKRIAGSDETQRVPFVIHAPGGVSNVLGDRELLSLAFRNLLSNAKKYSPPNTIVNINLTDDTKYVTVQITDEGIGIPPNDKDRVFSWLETASNRDKVLSFYQANRIEKFKSTGMGLAIVKATIEGHGGSIRIAKSVVEPNIQTGTTFEVKLPVYRGSKNESS